jgi:hypothetical protein
MLGEISAAFSSFRAIQTIAEGLPSVRDGAKIEAAVSEIRSRLLEAQGSVFAANERLQKLQDENHRLHGEIATLRNWDREKDQYELQDLQSGALVYALKPNQTGPDHSLCPNCFDQSRKSILQKDKLDLGASERLVCFDCDFNVYVRGARMKDHPPHSARRR